MDQAQEATITFNKMLAACGQPIGEEPKISDALYQRARLWPVYQSTTRPADRPAELPALDCIRCKACDEVVYPEHGTVGHLLQAHGYRMDGRQWTDSNEEVL